MISRKKKLLMLLVLLGLAGGGAYTAVAGDSDGHANEAEHAAEGKDGHGAEEGGHGDEGHGEEGHEEEGGEKSKISDASAAAMEIETLKAGPSTVHQTVGLTGKVTLNQNRMAQVRARFPGIVRDVKKVIGDTVEAGEIIATVESNESLQVYPIKAPLAGVVIARNTNIGDVAEAEPLFVVADLTQLWAEFFIFARDLERVKPGQKIDVNSLSDSSRTEATISSLLPVAESSSQTVVARVAIDNADNKWRSGMTVRGDVVLSEREVPVAVKSAAIQRQEGATVVYVKEGETYEARKIEVGDNDGEWAEILAGVQAGEEYVATNSFVVKADIGKSAAGHEH